MNKLPNGKVEFEKLEQIHVNIDEASANGHTITNAIKSKWGVGYIVVTGDGLPINDSASTQGIYKVSDVYDNYGYLLLFNVFMIPSSLCLVVIL